MVALYGEVEHRVIAAHLIEAAQLARRLGRLAHVTESPQRATPQHVEQVEARTDHQGDEKGVIGRLHVFGRDQHRADQRDENRHSERETRKTPPVRHVRIALGRRVKDGGA